MVARRDERCASVLRVCGAAAGRLQEAKVEPAEAVYDEKLSLFMLAHDDVRNSPDPEDALLRFCQSTYEAAANAGKWDRDALERHDGPVQR